MIHAYLEYKVFAIQKYFMGIVSLIKEMSGKSTYVSVIGLTHFIN
jgi:hypothetical protein